MKDGCNTCRYRLELWKLDYRGRGCKHTKMKGFLCTAFADEGVANWMLGLDDDNSKCECWQRKIKRNDEDEASMDAEDRG